MEVTVTLRSLAELEAVIEAGLTAFVQVGEALLAIREHRMYRETHDSFETYCRERFNFNRQRASQLIEAAEVSRILDTAPVRASHAEALAPLKEDPEAVREVYAEVQAQTSGRPTAADYGAAVDQRLGIERSQPVRRAPDPDFTDDFVEDISQDFDDVPVKPTIGALVEPAFVIPPRGLDPHAKAWHAAVAPAMYRRLDPDAVIATREPQEIERGIAMMADTIEYVGRLIEAARAAAGHARLEVVR